MKRFLFRGLSVLAVSAGLVFGSPVSSASANMMYQTGCYEYVDNACTVIEDIAYDTATGRYAIGHLDLRTGSYTITVYN